MTIIAFTSITFDKAEYSPYYHNSLTGADYNVLRATIVATGADGDPLYATLVNQDNNRQVATKVLTLAGGTALATFDLRHDCLDVDGIFRGKQGLYTVVASTLPDATGLLFDSPSIPVMAVPVAELKEVWLRGISLTDERNPVPQVQGLTGVLGASVSDVQRGGYPLTWSAATRLLSWDGGPPATIPVSGFPLDVTLWGPTLDQTVTVQVDPLNVPASDTTGYLMVDYAPLGDDFLRNQLRAAYDRLENQLGIPVEPTQAVTDQLASQFPNLDSTAWPATYQPPTSSRKPVRFQTGCRHVEKLHKLGGYYGETEVLTIPNQVVSIDRDNGFIELVPSINGQFPAPTVAGFGIFAMYNMPYMGLPATVPKFWQYAVTYGLENMDNARYGPMAREWIARAAAVEVLMLLGRAKTSYLAGESFARDGGSISRSFTNGQYGVYSDLVFNHLQWLQTNGASLRRKLAGIVVSVSGR